MLKINEVFFSIQGESSYAGHPSVFIRTSGCPLRCTYCDTTYAYYEGEKLSLEKIIEKVQSYPTKFVCVTGGEPLSQPLTFELMKKLCDLDYFVSCETSGAISCEDLDLRVKKIVDVKTPDSGAADSFNMANLACATEKDEFKFVICSEKDFLWAENFVKTHLLKLNCLILFSPSFESVSAKQLADWMLKSVLAREVPIQYSRCIKMQLQLHKYIWSPNTRGV